MAAYMEFDLNDSQSSYSPSSSSPSIGRLSVWSDQEEDKLKPYGKFCDHQFGEANKDQGRQVEEDHEDSDRGSYKWMPSKMRILRKMMSSNRMNQGSDSGPKFEEQKRSPLEDVDHNQSNTTHKSSFKSLTNEAVRVCSDCNTTKTPLWRSGPRGPKSLCNACGIRQRKARRAMAAAAAAAAATNGTILPLATVPLKIKLKHKNKRPKIDLLNDTDQSNKRRQVVASPSSDGVEEKLIRFEEFTTRILSGFEKVFPQDEKEAAILLMALSYGLVCSS